MLEVQAARERDRWLGRVRQITVAAVVAALSLVGLLAAAAAATFPGHQVPRTSGANPGGASASVGGSGSGQSGGTSSQPQPPTAGSISAGQGPATVSTGAS